MIRRAALVLFLIGDPEDSPRLFAGKFATENFDLATGFDGRAIFGAGQRETLEWLKRNGSTSGLQTFSIGGGASWFPSVLQSQPVYQTYVVGAAHTRTQTATGP